jgi:endoribonuclease Dicer
VSKSENHGYVGLMVGQQAKVIREYTDLKVGTYYGEMNVDAWKSETWETELEKIEVIA